MVEKEGQATKYRLPMDLGSIDGETTGQKHELTVWIGHSPPRLT